MQDYPLVIECWPVPSTECNETDEAFFFYVLHHEPDLVHVSSKHHFELIAMLDCDQVAHRIFTDLIDMPFKLFFYKCIDVAFTTRNTVGIG